MKLKCKKGFVQCVEKVLWLIKCVESGLRSFVLEISCWMILPWSGRPGEVDSDQIEMLIENNKRYTTWEIADVLEISKSIVIGENEKCVFYFMEKTKTVFLANQIWWLCLTAGSQNSKKFNNWLGRAGRTQQPHVHVTRATQHWCAVGGAESHPLSPTLQTARWYANQGMSGSSFQILSLPPSSSVCLSPRANTPYRMKYSRTLWPLFLSLESIVVIFIIAVTFF